MKCIILMYLFLNNYIWKNNNNKNDNITITLFFLNKIKIPKS